MKLYSKLTVALIFLSLFTVSAMAQKSRKKTVRQSRPKVVKPSLPAPPAEKMDYKILLEGSQSKVEAPLVFVARDAETYALMRSLVEGLPASSTVDFSKNAVVAAFAGMRNTGGWSVSIVKGGTQTSIKLSAPPKGGMTTQVITMPFQIALVPLETNSALSLALDSHWMQALKWYRVTKGDFEYTGGIAGRTTKFKADGTIGILSDGMHHTYLFDLKGKNGDGGRRLYDVASGVVNAGQIEIARIEPGSFAEMPHPPIKMMGTMNGEKLVLNFTSLAPTVSDGFMAMGKLEAAKAK